MDRQTELEVFKTNINLVEYAARSGYEIDRKASSRNSVAMTGPDGKIIVGIGDDDHWIYCCVHNSGDKGGSIIDFDQRRKGGDIGDVRKRLRAWQTDPGTALARAAAFPRPSPIRKDMLQVRARFAAMEPVNGRHPYLQLERCIPAYVLTDARFAGRIYVDHRRNAVFPHMNRDGISGYEIKNRDFTGFAPGGEKALWCSRAAPGDNALVIAETAIDALSHHTFNLPKLTRYISIAGQMSDEQQELVRAAMEKMQSGGKIILALDNDKAGDALAGKITAIHAEIKGRACALVDDRPPRRGDDWNDVLKANVFAAPTARPSSATSPNPR